MSRPALQWMPGFIHAARNGNLTRAAEQLNLTVGALSHQIRALEERLGQRLFERNPRGMRLTTEGQALFDQLDPHYQAIERLLAPHGPMRGNKLTLSVLASMANAWLLPRLSGFVAENPDVQINLEATTRRVDFEIETHVDAGIRFGLGGWPKVHSDLLFHEWLVPAASPELIERLGKPKLSELHRYPLIDDPGGRWKPWCTHFGFPLPKRFAAVFDESESSHRAAAEGVGVLLARLTLASPFVKTGRLVLLSKQRLKADYAYYLVYPDRSLRQSGFRLFRDWIIAQAAES